jgi:hypothetical protein
VTPRPRLLDLSIAITAAALIVAVVSFGWALTRAEPWTPLGPFPEQSVDTDATVRWEGRQAGLAPGDYAAIPAIPLTGPVPVTGTKCYDENVQVYGDVHWSTVDPKGGLWQTGSGTATQKKGCHTLSFRNEVPDVVADYVANTDRPFAVVTISGCETPVSEERGEGETYCWTTEPFALVP